MLSNLGNILLFLNVILSLSIIYTANRNLKISGGVDKNIFQLSLIQSTSIIICFFVLIAAFIVSDFSLITVYQNSHSLKPLFYKIAGTWGNHEGSLMLWAIILSIFSFLFLVYNKNHPKKFRLLTLIIQNILILGFLFFILFNSNPFSKISPIPSEGLGLNPILQDPALATITLCRFCWCIYLFFSSNSIINYELFREIIFSFYKKLGFNILVLSNTWNSCWIYMGLL